MNDDSLESLLKQADRSAGPPPSPVLHMAAEVRQRYGAWQRRRRRLTHVGAMLVCYSAGLLSMWGWRAAVERPEPRQAAHRETAAQQPKREQAPLKEPVPASPDGDVPGRTANEPGPLLAMENFTARSDYRRLRRLGDQYLLHKGKVDIALDFYSRALDVASKDDLEIAHEEDTWLLRSLKEDRMAWAL